ncbi:MAG: HIT family protein [Polyangiaceae bacterium]|nr:HIT family protein [Polyangiaceae bacterium]
MPYIDKPSALAKVEAEAASWTARYDGCAMCAMVDGMPHDVERLAESPVAIAVLDRYATRPGHLLVILRRHVESISSLSWEEYAGVQRLSWEAARALEKVCQPRRIFVAALGAPKKRINSFPHHHVHVIPVDSDGEDARPARVLSWEFGVYVYDEGEARSMGDALRAAWPR